MSASDFFWERWRRDLHERCPEISQEYRHDGRWHEDFSSLHGGRPWQDEEGRWHYPSKHCFVSRYESTGGYNKADLIRRGWTRKAIQDVLKEPDRKLLRKGYPPNRPECVYNFDRVHAAEENGVTRYRSTRGTGPARKSRARRRRKRTNTGEHSL